MRLPVLTLATSMLALLAADLPAALAQIPADVVIGRNGERIFLDPNTGEVLTIQPPSQVRELPAEPRFDRRDEPFLDRRDREAEIRDIIRAERQAERQRRQDLREAMRRERERADERQRERSASIEEQVPVIRSPEKQAERDCRNRPMSPPRKKTSRPAP